jgi:hypothetical protein
MRLSEEMPIDPELLAELEAIDATLRGEAVDPVHADLAELALLLADQRPELPAAAARSLDEAAARRFEPAGTAADPDDGGASASQRPRNLRWALRPAFGIGLAGLAAVAIAAVVVLNGNSIVGSSTPSSSANLALAPAGARAGSPSSSSSSSSAGASGSGSTGSAAGGTGLVSGGNSSVVRHAAATAPAGKPGDYGPAVSSHKASSAAGSGGSVPAAQALVPPAANQTVVPTPQSNGRKVIQSAQLQLLAPGNRIDDVSQEVFTVVGAESGVVKSSTITAASGDNGYAIFQLSIPSQNLALTMTRLSTLQYAHVASRTDATQDVNSQYLNDVRRLADARALRTALLKQLAAATTQAQIDSITAQIQGAEASISSDQATLAGLNHAVNFSDLQVQINAGTVPPVVPVTGSSSGFTIGRAWHDAVRVLTVVAGVSLIALAVLLPLGLIAALAAWIAYWMRRRRREAALDAA